MSLDLETTTAETAHPCRRTCSTRNHPSDPEPSGFVGEFGDELLDALNSANPPVYTGQPQAHRQLIVASLKRKLSSPGRSRPRRHRAADRPGERAAIVNGEMGCGRRPSASPRPCSTPKATAAPWCFRHPPGLQVAARDPGDGGGRQRSGCSTARIRWSSSSSCVSSWASSPRVRVLRPGPRADADGLPLEARFTTRRTRHGDVAACPDCGTVITDLDGEPVNPVALEAEESRRKCGHCAAPCGR